MRVVVGYDGSESSLRALEWALDEATLRRLPLTVVHAWQWPCGTADEQVREHLRSAAEHVLWHGAKRVMAQAATGDVEMDLYEGHAAGRLVELSAGAELVVVGSLGLGGLRRVAVGSVAAHVVGHARCPVIVVRGCSPAPSWPCPVIAVATRWPWEAVLDFAFQEAALRQLPLLAIEPCTGRSRAEDQEGPPSDGISTAELRRLVIARQGRYPGVLVEMEPAPDTPQEAVEILSREARLLVVSEGHAARVAVEHATCPVAVIRPLRVPRSGPATCPDGALRGDRG
ncbi:universal stress protein [Nonomuraea sp. NPDC050536]|uniref:universal stress protein n=1 Tax=Nonomuraea sp. NPDC050536 TaxID=3364366 RepID=UPI0037C7536A